jgi:hypothetical protein
MARYPETVDQIRLVEPVQHARGGRMTRVIMRLDNGRAVSFYEVAIGGCAAICGSRADAFEFIRRGA